MEARCEKSERSEIRGAFFAFLAYFAKQGMRMSYFDKLPQPNQERAVSQLPEEPVIMEPAEEAVRARPVFWESQGRIFGPATVTDFAKAGDEYWLWIEYRGEGRWIRDVLLRSRAQFEAQSKVEGQ